MVAVRKALLKDTLREIKRTFARFVSIFAIVALGVGFFAGVKATCPDMQQSADNYFDENNLTDLRLVSTMGFNDNDVDAISKTEGVSGIMPAYTADVMGEANGEKAMALRLHSMDISGAGGKDDINIPQIVEGRLPEKSGECVMDAYHGTRKPLNIGDKVTLASGSDEDIADSLKVTEYTVVGTVVSPYYISLDRGTTSVGKGSIDAYMLVPKEDFNFEVYTDVYVTVQGAREASSFAADYKDIVAGAKDNIKATAAVREAGRYDEVMSEANETLSDAKKELADAEEEANTKLSDARKELDDAKKKLTDGEREYYDGKKEFDEKIADGQKQLDDGYKEYRKGYDEMYYGECSYLAGLKKYQDAYPDAIAALDAGKKQYEDGLAAYSGADALCTSLSGALSIPDEATRKATIGGIAGQMTDPSLAQLQGALQGYAAGMVDLATVQGAVAGFRQQLDSTKAQLDTAKQKLDSGYAELRSAASALSDAGLQIDRAKKELKEAKKTLDEKSEELAKAKKDGEKELADAWQEIVDGKAELADGEKEYLDAKLEAETKISDAKVELADGEKKLSELKKPEWYLMTRSDIPGNSSYKDDTERIDAISKVFPLFFFIVAALVCLTTMARMVEEQRTQIGTIKALGYSKGSIVMKFVIYSAVASIAGSVTGLLIGFKLFPTVISSAYSMLYNMPKISTPFHWSFAIATTLVAVLCTTAAVLFACYAELAEHPANLMRPKAPKPGKRVLLERIPFIWSRLKFGHKVTIRNLFRYKARIIMTILGIAGCTALMLTGFGLKTSISAIVDKQFGEIYKYDGMVIINEKADEADKQDFKDIMAGDDNIATTMNVRQLNFNATSDTKDVPQETTIFVPERTGGVGEYIELRDRHTRRPITIGEDGAVISEKLGKLLNVGVGDTFTMKDSDGKEVHPVIADITENYAMHYAYMSPQYYEKLFGEKPVYNTVMCSLKDDSNEAHDRMSERLVSNKSVVNVTYNSSIRDNFDDVMGSMNYIVLVLIISAGALAFVVLYNLTNINVNERIREIATIKVLGFYDLEVSQYIYRENIILTFLGILLGLGGGVLLHQFVVVKAEIDLVMFGRDIGWQGFLFASLLTLLFSVLVNLVLHFKLKKVSMVESLKSVEYISRGRIYSRLNSGA